MDPIFKKNADKNDPLVSQYRGSRNKSVNWRDQMEAKFRENIISKQQNTQGRVME